MLARGGGKPFDDENYGFEVKWDGMRSLIIADQPYRLQNRHLKTVTPQFPELDFGSLPLGTVVDGEIVVLKEGVPSFYALQKRSHLQSAAKIALAASATLVTFMAFDLLYYKGRNITALPLSERRSLLEKLLASNRHKQLALSDQIVGRGKAYFEAVAQRGLEGVIAKRLDSSYLEGKRSSAWIKIVTWQEKPLSVLGYVREHGEEKVKAVALGRKRGGRCQYLGQVGGLEEDDKKLLYAALKDAKTLSPVPENAPANVEWRDIDLRCYVRYFQDTASGRLRQASFKGWVP